MKNYKVLLNPWYLEKSFNWMFRECCWTGSFGPLLFSNNSWPRVAGFAAWLCLKYMWHCDSSRALAADGNCVCIQTTRGQITLMILSCFWLKVFSLAGSQAARLWDTGFYASVAVCCDKYLFASVMSEGQIHPFFLKMALTRFTRMTEQWTQECWFQVLVLLFIWGHIISLLLSLLLLINREDPDLCNKAPWDLLIESHGGNC